MSRLCICAQLIFNFNNLIIFISISLIQGSFPSWDSDHWITMPEEKNTSSSNDRTELAVCVCVCELEIISVNVPVCEDNSSHYA